jgi:hypothetical protein
MHLATKLTTQQMSRQSDSPENARIFLQFASAFENNDPSKGFGAFTPFDSGKRFGIMQMRPIIRLLLLMGVLASLPFASQI